jgi:16S rRNA C1402 N4-methylase RsmH
MCLVNAIRVLNKGMRLQLISGISCKSRIVQQVFDKYNGKKEEVLDHLMNRKTRLVVQLTIGLCCHLP